MKTSEQLVRETAVRLWEQSGERFKLREQNTPPDTLRKIRERRIKQYAMEIQRARRNRTLRLG